LIGRGKKKLLLEVDEILEKKDHGEEISKIDKYILDMTHVSNFNDFGDDKQHDKDFESLCAYMQKETTQNVKYLTVMEFYSLLVNTMPKKK
jgi:hypothetical protein